MDFGMLGAAVVMGIAAIGSAIGIGIAGQGAIGAWKRCYINNNSSTKHTKIHNLSPYLFSFSLKGLYFKPDHDIPK